ncbi:MAG: MBL fold metallo-hydrolase [Paraperlucidibaca sp.]|jgi:glyoxylase-like metal-dependent hydrolase (beta-lactamase superfamily II)|uniref:MBL fold metallo-hydrolase n=1 Tax=Paraperlucidibaca sp. TaxID=2708021 RepID=UPI001B40A5B9|nr:MBL fold metallo-hydrolase [Paraperlucidibaca sp.]MBQ0722056.1 MBL fold metallo-hydrolase [Paraperlucidibaca sp.]MBQ0841505.1 MBL fold metallo-hydrolase [Paraperlucidibaca sp.]|tara:strand:- start:808 stop:1671 length:864 start_codon:yes stop_codon:yes gene_type:complete
MSTQVASFFDTATSTVSYIVHAGAGSACAIIDSVLDYDPKAGRTHTESADKLIAFVHEHTLTVQWLLETHAHADHLSAAPYLQTHLGGTIAIGESIRQVQGVFQKIFNLDADFALDGSQFGHLFHPDENFMIGDIPAQAIHVPGHTPADMAYVIDNKIVFVGDTLFMPDVGSARCDFPGGNAKTLYKSAQRILSMPDDTLLYMCHDYPPASREASWETTVADQRASNIHLHDGATEAEFVEMRSKRDATLGMPTLILPAIQINIRAGHFPPTENNGVAYLKLPLNAL